MAQEWQELTQLTQGHRLIVERVRLPEKDICIEGSFELPPLANLTLADQVFVSAFIRCHGSIKRMEEIFSVSYPTIKNRLNRISEQVGLVEEVTPDMTHEVLERLERGEISVKEALDSLQ